MKKTLQSSSSVKTHVSLPKNRNYLILVRHIPNEIYILLQQSGYLNCNISRGEKGDKWIVKGNEYIEGDVVSDRGCAEEKWMWQGEKWVW